MGAHAFAIGESLSTMLGTLLTHAIARLLDQVGHDDAALASLGGHWPCAHARSARDAATGHLSDENDRARCGYIPGLPKSSSTFRVLAEAVYFTLRYVSIPIAIAGHCWHMREPLP